MGAPQSVPACCPYRPFLTTTKTRSHKRGGLSAVPPFFVRAASPGGRYRTGHLYGGAPIPGAWSTRAVITVPFRHRLAGRASPALCFGARLPGPFGLCAGAGFHHDRLSGAPLRDLLLPFVAFQLYRYYSECMKQPGRCQGTGGVLESSWEPVTAENAATRRAPRRYGPCPRSWW